MRQQNLSHGPKATDPYTGRRSLYVVYTTPHAPRMAGVKGDLARSCSAASIRRCSFRASISAPASCSRSHTGRAARVSSSTVGVSRMAGRKVHSCSSSCAFTSSLFHDAEVMIWGSVGTVHVICDCVRYLRFAYPYIHMIIDPQINALVPVVVLLVVQPVVEPLKHLGAAPRGRCIRLDVLPVLFLVERCM